MKTLAVLFTFSLLSFSTMANDNHSSLKSVSSDDENLIKFRVNKDLIGATINLVYSNGDVVTEELLVKKRMTIDLRAVKTGDYTVIIEKGEVKEHINIRKNLKEGVQFGIDRPISG